MYRISQKRALHKFKCVRVLSGKDLFKRLGERLPHDAGSVMPRNPITRYDMADSIILDGYSRLQEKELDVLPPDIPPAEPDSSTE